MVNILDYEGAMGNLRFRLAEQDDAEFIVSLRTDPSLGEHLSATSGDLSAQRNWLARYKTDEALGRQLYYMIVRDEEPVGTVRIYDIQPDSFVSGSWVLRPGLPATASITTVLFTYDLGYKWLNLPNQRISVRKGNESVLRFHRKMGARPTGDSDSEFFFELSRDAYLGVRPRYERLARCEGQSIVWTKVR